MNEKEAIKSMREFAYTIHGTLSVKEAQTVLNLLEKKDKIIDLLINELTKLDESRTKQEVKQYFERKVEEDK